MFNKNKPNVVLISDMTHTVEMNRTLGVHKLAHCLREDGYEVAVIHFLSVFTIDEITHILTNLISDKTLFVGVSNFFYKSIADIVIDDSGNVTLNPVEPGSILPHGKQFNQTIKSLINTLNPNCKLVVGGPTALDTSYNNDFDYVVIGYSEISIVKLAQHLENPGDKLLVPNYKSIYGPIIINDAKAEGYDFSKSTMSYRDEDAIMSGETLLLEIGRGCVFKCAFCAHPLNGKKKFDYIREHGLIRQELIKNYEMFGTTNYIIIDDTFNDSVQKCKDFHDMTKTLPFKINWWGYIRLDLLAAHPETIEYLFDSGLRAAFFGIETLNPKVGSIIGKGGTRQKLFDTVKYIKDKYGNKVSLHGSFIFGLPHESLDSMKETADFLLSDINPLDSWMIEPCRISPADRNYAHGFQSDIDINYKKYGYIDLDEGKRQNLSFDKLNHSLLNMNWKNEYTSSDELEQLVSEVHKSKNDKLYGSASFYLASLGIPVDLVLNKKLSEHNWYAYDLLKFSRSQKYKKLLYSKLGIPPFFTNLLGIKTYSKLLQSGLLLKEIKKK